MARSDPPPSIADSDAFVNLLHVAREDADVRRQLQGLLSLAGFHRRSAVHTFTERMRQRGAPPAFVQAIGYLADDAVAARARELLEAMDPERIRRADSLTRGNPRADRDVHNVERRPCVALFPRVESTMQTFDVQHRSVILRLAANDNGSRSTPLVDQVPAAGDASQTIVLDLQGITLNSMLIGELASLVQHLRGQPLFLVNVSHLSRGSLKTVGLAGLLHMLDDLSDLPEAASAHGR